MEKCYIFISLIRILKSPVLSFTFSWVHSLENFFPKTTRLTWGCAFSCFFTVHKDISSLIKHALDPREVTKPRGQTLQLTNLFRKLILLFQEEFFKSWFAWRQWEGRTNKGKSRVQDPSLRYTFFILTILQMSFDVYVSNVPIPVILLVTHCFDNMQQGSVCQSAISTSVSEWSTYEGNGGLDPWIFIYVSFYGAWLTGDFIALGDHEFDVWCMGAGLSQFWPFHIAARLRIHMVSHMMPKPWIKGQSLENYFSSIFFALSTCVQVVRY